MDFVTVSSLVLGVAAHIFHGMPGKLFWKQYGSVSVIFRQSFDCELIEVQHGVFTQCSVDAI